MMLNKQCHTLRYRAMCSGFRIVLGLVAVVSASSATAQEFRAQFQPLIDAACIPCHDGSENNGLDFATLGNDLGDAAVFGRWVRVFDRLERGEMPPATEPRPDTMVIEPAQSSLRHALTAANLAQQELNGRVILRRLNRTEYNDTLQDLFGFDVDLTEMIPEENASTGFDTVFTSQGLSPLHVQSFLTAADAALDGAIQLGRKPDFGVRHFEYKQHKGVRKHIDENKERVVVGELDDAIIMFNNASYLFKVEDLHLEHTGRYRIRAEAYAYQSTKPVVLTLNAGNYSRGQTRVLGFFDIEPGEPVTVEVEATLNNNEYLFPGAEDLDVQPDGKTIWNRGPDEYTGSGIALKWIEVEGPLVGNWPPKSTTNFLAGVEVRELEQIRWRNDRHIQYEIIAGDDPNQQIAAIVTRLARIAFRRPLASGDVDPYLALARTALEEGRDFDSALRIACRGVLCSPEFLFFAGRPGPLDNFALASRLSYFFWKSMPDDELLQLAGVGTLADPHVLRQQVDRLLNDRKSARFVRDFVGQWLRLVDINATSPDSRLYPEFDELLKISMLGETESFIAHLIDANLSTSNLIDSDFAFLNRRLAEHYGIDGIRGQQFQKVVLPANSARGGMMAQASVLKVTANGTVTSPVRRGSWVLTHLLGRPPDPPPPGVGAIEPDTRGTTTIRETLAKHRNVEACASCHRSIDPPGFALECFDVIGGFREHYRSVDHGQRPELTLHGRPIWEYKLNLPVDASGETAEGQAFSDIAMYRKLLLNENEQVARNVISQMVVYATGADIQFADRTEIEQILDTTREHDFGMRAIIHEIVQSRLFRNK